MWREVGCVNLVVRSNSTFDSPPGMKPETDVKFKVFICPIERQAKYT